MPETGMSLAGADASELSGGKPITMLVPKLVLSVIHEAPDSDEEDDDKVTSELCFLLHPDSAIGLLGRLVEYFAAINVKPDIKDYSNVDEALPASIKAGEIIRQAQQDKNG